LDELEGHPDRAADKYLLAIRRGENRLAIARRTLRLLFNQRRYAEAGELLNKLPEQTRTDPDFGRLAAQLELAAGEGEDPAARRKRALELARQTVDRGPKSYQ